AFPRGRRRRIKYRASDAELVVAREERGDEVEHDEVFEGKGQETEEADEGHFKVPNALAERKNIDPLRVRPLVPEFPQQAAQRAGGEQLERAREIAVLPVPIDAGQPSPIVERFQQEK